MKQVSLRTLHLGVAALLLSGLAFVACAESDSSTPVNEPPGPQPIPPPDVDGGLDAGNADGGCADASGCLTTTDCTRVDFCSAPFPVSREASLNSVWGTGPDDVWAVGTRGTILHGNQDGFTPVPTDIDGIFFAVWGTSKNDIWTVAGGTP
ncbi:MAG: hypothetical protein K0S65_3285, partial [Labilithrix sp.]|nr:hypothetical protein [Labilithrix sp.]